MRRERGRALAIALAAIAAAAVLACPGCRSVPETPPPLRVMSLNVRLPLESDGPDDWPRRREAMAALIRKASPDVLGTQELMRNQADELSVRLPAYAWFGVGRRGGAEDEHMGVFYRRDALRLLDSGHFWLSDTPQVPGSISWGHPYPRMATWGLFERVADGLRFHLLNTHLPYRPEDRDARLRGAGLILERIAGFGDGPVIVLGDFNERPDGALHRRLREVLGDAWLQAPLREGPGGTFHGFSGVPGDRIDWILQRGLRVRRASTLAEPVAGRHVSDHFPVLVELEPGRPQR